MVNKKLMKTVNEFLNLMKNKWFFGFIVFIILFKLVLLFYLAYKPFATRKENYENEPKKISLQNLRNLLTNNLMKGTITRMTIPKEILETEDCSSKCDYEDCIKMDRMKRNLKDCEVCQMDPKKCFRKSIIGGNCEDCMEGEEQMNCLSTDNFGCTSPADINSMEGAPPYFISVPDDNLNSPYDKKCIMCWQIKEYV